MNKKFSHTYNAGNWVGLGTAIGAIIFILTKDPLWIALGVVIGEAVVGIGTTQNGSDAKYIVKTVSTQDDTDAFNENTPFETEADSILDFSEINPFGEF